MIIKCVVLMNFFFFLHVADVAKFFSQLKQFAFYADLDSVMQEVGGIEKALTERRHGDVLRYLLTDVGLNYGDRPKGLLRFHTYVGADGSVERRVPIEEHLVEGAQVQHTSMFYCILA